MTVQGPNEVPKAAESQMKFVIPAVIVLILIAVIGAAVIFGSNNDDDDADNESTDNSAQVDNDGEADDAAPSSNNESDSDNSVADDTENEGASDQCTAFDDENCFPTWVGLEQGETEDGIPTLGSANAPIIVGEFSDFGCPHCLDFAPTFDSLVNDYAGDGQAQFYYFPLTFVRGENSVTAAQVAICTIDQDAFWQFHQVLFEIQESPGYQAFTIDNLVGVAGEMGLDEAAILDCLQSPRPASVLAAATTLQSSVGVTGTPAIVISTDGGETWTLLEDRSEANIRSVIEAANS